MKKEFAPIVLFTFNRPWHTRQTIEALRNNDLASKSDLIIFSDAPRNENDKPSVEEVRAYLKTISGFKSVKIIEQNKNKGLQQSVIEGVTQVINQYGKVIVIEDDLVTSPTFLKYMNDSLHFYENNDEVISIHGYIYPVKGDLPKTFFIKGADCWGWATWKRGWDLFEPDGKKLLKALENQKLTKEFDFNGTYPYTQMLIDQIAGKNSSWAIRWYASAFLLNKLTLYPGKSLIQNIGLDSSGTHGGANKKRYQSDLDLNPVTIGNIQIEENKDARTKIEKYFKGIRPKTAQRISQYFKNIFSNK